MKFYTYIWRDAAGVPFYVGKGARYRAQSVHGRSEAWQAVHSQGGCSVEIVDYFMSESEAYACEMELIERYGRREFGGLLVNRSEGGWVDSGWRQTDEAIAKARAVHLGRKRSPETCARISEGRRGIPHDMASRAKMSAAHRGKKLSDEHVERQSEGKRRRYEDPAQRAKTGAAGRKLPPGKRNTSGFKGVSFEKSSNKWYAAIFIDGRYVNLGRFSTKEAAARAYDAAAIDACGVGNCYLNFPDQARGLLTESSG